MAALRIVIGFDGEDKPLPVYVGRSGTEAEQAKADNTTAARFETFTGVVGVKKRNPNFKPKAGKAKESK